MKPMESKPCARLVKPSDIDDICNRLRSMRDRWRSLEAFYEEILSMPDCNDCQNKTCQCRPAFGETVRFNCPLWQGEKTEELEQ